MKILRLLFLIIGFGWASFALGQTTYSGNVLDANDRQVMEGVTVRVLDRESTSTTNQRGYFSVQGVVGDTLLVEFEGFVSQKIPLGKERFLMIEIQDKARFLPTFEVRSPAYSYRFKDGRLVLRDENEVESPSRKGEVIAGPINRGDGSGGIAFSGVISYFTKKARYAREYARKQEWHKRRVGYYSIIESDSIKAKLKEDFQISSEDWNELIIRFNQFHASHEFLDWSESRVYNQLRQFIEIETTYMD
ncbi:carboxypeptidase-like regulatory domain-containing protein [Algoriphagus hitonicola]|uniref:CarboxypepD_reg-like domain-containing protein n=1 Tax=Algoriphagus hitonicola TaxID=435880 RepID=A0A1I2RT83_9BACT|nr:carboxypeptidase-like regulatory domain-containing protein [Algoriphagus hitonicola]SFG41021.1 hypothetical protein SAMN04487988_103294 [Algoriphagus hitonicola]